LLHLRPEEKAFLLKRVLATLAYTERAFDLFALNFSVCNYCARLAAKHSPHSTGLPLEGLKGTLSVLPH